MFDKSMNIADFDPDLWAAMQHEETRQEDHIELIASENYTSPRVMQAQGSVLTNKYAEGYPSKRYYGGCEYRRRRRGTCHRTRQETVRRRLCQRTAALRLAGQRRGLFCAVEPGHDTILGMSLSDGGHLTHGAKVNFSGKLFNAVQYGLNSETGEVDYDQVERSPRSTSRK